MSTIPTSTQVARKLRFYRDQYDSKASIHHYHVSEVNILTQDVINYLQDFTIDDSEIQRAFSMCINRLRKVIENSNEFYKGIKLIPKNPYDYQSEDEYSHPDPSFWYQQVIGGAEGAVNDLLESMGEERH